MRIPTKQLWRAALLAVLASLLVAPLGTAFASDHLPPVPITSPRDPLPIPNSKVLSPTAIFNDLLVPALPTPSKEADAFALSGKPGVLPKISNIANGITLNYMNAPEPSSCVDFDKKSKWKGDVFTDYYRGWGPFAVDDGGFYRSRNVVFSMERVVGPGKHYGDGYSLKIASTQPYAAGVGSPIIEVDPGDQVTVKARYLIYNHGNISTGNQWAYDWASLGVKPDAYGDTAIYVNGYVRGQWAELTNTITAGQSGKIMVLLQAQSPAALNSNIYFDDVEIYVNGKALKKKNCR